MTTSHANINYLHLYITGPNGLIEKGYQSRILDYLHRVLDEKCRDDLTHVSFILNAEEKDIQAIVTDFKQNYPDLKVVTLEADFAKFKKQAYIKRNKKGIAKASHIFIFTADQVRNSPTVDFIMTETEGLVSKATRHIHLNPLKEANHGGK